MKTEKAGWLLTKSLVASVQDRMRRREIEANAILNRRAVAGLVPSLRR